MDTEHLTYNRFIRQIVSSNSLNVDLMEFQIILVPYPASRFLMTYSPLSQLRRPTTSTPAEPEISEH